MLRVVAYCVERYFFKPWLKFFAIAWFIAMFPSKGNKSIDCVLLR